MYTHHEFKCKLSTGEDVYWNRISGDVVEVDHDRLIPPTAAQALEIAQIVADDDAVFSEECEREKAASSQTTDLW